MTVVAIIFAMVAFGFAVAMLVIANNQRDKPGLVAAGRLAALRYALVGVGLLAGLYWFGFVIVALALWVVLLPVGYVLARRGWTRTYVRYGESTSLELPPALFTPGRKRVQGGSRLGRRARGGGARAGTLASGWSRCRRARRARGAGRADLRVDQGPRRAPSRGDQGVARGRASQCCPLGGRENR